MSQYNLKQKYYITHANGSLVTVDHKIKYIDLFNGHGAVWLGHNNSSINNKMIKQIRSFWVTNTFSSEVKRQIQESVEKYFPKGYEFVMQYSTGMEAVEFALRVAYACTKRKKIIGFNCSMHGKSLATSAIGWHNKYAFAINDFCRVSFPKTIKMEKIILTELEEKLKAKDIAAVFIEPILGSGGGYMASMNFYNQLNKICRKYGTLLIFYEILTGVFRTGKAFFFNWLDFIPDIILLGKALGNGFPVSGVVLRKGLRISDEMLPGSTYSFNPLAAVAISATMHEVNKIDIGRKVTEIAKIIQTNFNSLKEQGIELRGLGALWVLEIPKYINIKGIIYKIYKNRVMLNYTGRYIRILPSCNIEHDVLMKAGAIIRTSIEKQINEK
jgi:acetylornithine/succinyldiaminopimelate/putrescine aminotransferase